MIKKHDVFINGRDSGTDVDPSSPFIDMKSLHLDIESQQESPIPHPIAKVFKFRPSTEYPKLRLLSSRTNIGLHVTLKAVIRRKSILIVTEREGDWWNCTCGGYQGWANIPNDMLLKRILVPIESLRRCEDWRGMQFTVSSRGDSFTCRWNE